MYIFIYYNSVASSVPNTILRQGANREFQRVNSHWSHQIIINFPLICRVMQLILSGFWPETRHLSGTLSEDTQ